MGICREDGCTKSASFGSETAEYCLAHKKTDMKNLTKKTCEFDGCQVFAGYGNTGTKPTRCRIHKEDDMVLFWCKKCTECQTQASYGWEDGPMIKCAKHKVEGMIYLRFPHCPECGTTARFGLVKNRPTHCSKHREPDMWNVIDRTCKECKKRPTYGVDRADYCEEHKKAGMTVFLRVFCKEDGCEKTAAFNLPGRKGGVYCTGHAREGMINIFETKCKICWAVRARKDYDGHCAQCFSHVFPDSPRIRKFKTKERAVKDFLVEKWPDSLMTHDKAVDCFRFRPDFVFELGSHTIVIEVDEEQHERYDLSCENKRLMSIFQGLGSRPMVMIRFNPDKYVDGNGKKVKGCWHGTGLVHQGGEWRSRLKELHGVIEKWWGRVPEKEVTVEHLFYDGYISGTGLGLMKVL